jgi:hypothetical protein
MARVEFQYLTEEKTEPLPLDTHITAILGQKTKRLYGLQMDIRAAGASGVNVVCQKTKLLGEVKRAFKSLQEAPAGSSMSNRYRLAEDAIEQNSDQLFSFT